MKLLSRREICSPSGDVYMKRLTLIECRWFSIKLHTIVRGDWARDLHDHPWSFITFIMCQGYWEVTPAGKFWRKPFRFYYRPAHWKHRVMIMDRPVRTIVFTGPKKREWGFWVDGEFVDWKSYEMDAVYPVERQS